DRRIGSRPQRRPAGRHLRRRRTRRRRHHRRHRHDVARSPPPRHRPRQPRQRVAAAGPRGGARRRRFGPYRLLGARPAAGRHRSPRPRGGRRLQAVQRAVAAAARPHPAPGSPWHRLEHRRGLHPLRSERCLGAGDRHPPRRGGVRPSAAGDHLCIRSPRRQRRDVDPGRGGDERLPRDPDRLPGRQGRRDRALRLEPSARQFPPRPAAARGAEVVL
ncbi:MAG: hypothetical protein AVDCRST_MAG59-763, partial [uncultured Thermomicrobiales bacterium]